MPSNPGEHIFQTTNSPTSGLNKNVNQEQDYLEVPDSLYVYSLGIKDIQATSIQYDEKQAYVTKPLNVTGNVMEIELETAEEHPVFDELNGKALGQQTSLEYYITYKDRPTVTDWIPILPLGEEEVIGERLMPNLNGQCELRFTAIISSIKCYANGLLMENGTYTITGEEALVLNNYNPSTIYTVSYEPNPYRHDPWTFKLSDYKKDVKRITETFTRGTAYNKTLELSYSPFIDLSKIREEEDYNPNTSNYQPIEVFLKNAQIQGPGNTILNEIQPYVPDKEDVAFTYNKTLYEDKSWSDMKNYNLTTQNNYLGFDYYQWGNKLVFTEHFNVPNLPENRHHTHGNADIEVNYDVLVTNFRLKVILRRNTSSSRTATPKLETFKVLFKTIE